MLTKEFNTIYKKSNNMEQISDRFFWINLTEKQYKKMYKQLKENGKHEIKLNDVTYLIVSDTLKIRKL